MGRDGALQGQGQQHALWCSYASAARARGVHNAQQTNTAAATSNACIMLRVRQAAHVSRPVPHSPHCFDLLPNTCCPALSTHSWSTHLCTGMLGPGTSASVVPGHTGVPPAAAAAATPPSLSPPCSRLPPVPPPCKPPPPFRFRPPFPCAPSSRTPAAAFPAASPSAPRPPPHGPAACPWASPTACRWAGPAACPWVGPASALPAVAWGPREDCTIVDPAATAPPCTLARPARNPPTPVIPCRLWSAASAAARAAAAATAWASTISSTTSPSCCMPLDSPPGCFCCSCP